MASPSSAQVQVRGYFFSGLKAQVERWVAKHIYMGSASHGDAGRPFSYSDLVGVLEKNFPVRIMVLRVAAGYSSPTIFLDRLRVNFAGFDALAIINAYDTG